MNKLKEFWENKPSEEKRKIIVYACFISISIFLFYVVYLINSDSASSEVANIENPHARDVEKYKNRSEANNMAKTQEQPKSNSFDYIVSSTTNEESFTDNTITTEEIVHIEPLRANESTKNSNSHETYGDYSMWSVEEPLNSTIGYSSNSMPTKNETNKEEYKAEQSIKNNLNIDVPQQQQQQSLLVDAKLISSGEVTNGRSLSVVLLENVQLNNVSLKKNQVLTGYAKIQNNRLLIEFKSVKIKRDYIPINAYVVGYDGISGIPIRATETTEIERNVDNTARTKLNTIPIIGGVLSSGTKKDNKLQLSDNINCTITFLL